VKLSADPVKDVMVTISALAGTSTISVKQGASITFTTDNWDTYQLVQLAATRDSLGSATFQLSGGNLSSVQVIATTDASSISPILFLLLGD
jgi:hypothetical protein